MSVVAHTRYPSTEELETGGSGVVTSYLGRGTQVDPKS